MLAADPVRFRKALIHFQVQFKHRKTRAQQWSSSLSTKETQLVIFCSREEEEKKHLSVQ